VRYTLGHLYKKFVTSSGAAIFPQDGKSYPELLKNADTAMYHAKDKRPGSSAFFSKALQNNLEKRLQLERGLSGATARGEFVLHYQPVIDVKQQKVVSSEALVRWNRPGQGLTMPGDFISVAEETGLIEEIGSWVLKQACMDLKKWLASGIKLDHVAVNVSGFQLEQKNFVAVVEDALEVSGLDARYLELEVTETALIEDFEESMLKLKTLRSLGVRIAVDDFGTGYSSLKYLKVLPADRLKIDRLFVRELPENTRDAAIISSLVTLSKELGLSLLAEGVETRQQVDFLRDSSIHAIQGFFYSKGLPEAEFLGFVRECRSDEGSSCMKSLFPSVNRVSSEQHLDSLKPEKPLYSL